jgi:hypothetical protein
MPYLPTWANVLLVYLFASIIFHLIYLIDRRTKREGAMFTQAVSPKSRVYAFVLAILLGGSFVIMWVVGFRDNIETGIVALASIGLFGYSIGLDRPLTQIQTEYQKTFHPKDYKSILGIEGLTFEELVMQVQAGGKFVMFEYCISPLVVTLDYNSNIYFIRASENALGKGGRYILITLLLGWASIFGPIHTARCLFTDFRGGKDLTQRVMSFFEWYYSQLEDNDPVSQNAP